MSLDKGKWGTSVKVAVLVLMIAQYANSMLSSVTGVLYAEFPDQLSLVKMVSTINYLACSIPLIFMEPLSARFTKKQLALFGIILVFVGVVPSFVYGMVVLFITQFICGMGIGFMYAFAASYIVDLWDGDEASKMMGNRSTVGAIAGILYAQFAGRVAAGGDYQPAFLCLLVMIPVFLICLKLPKTYPVEIADKEARLAAKTAGGTKTKKMYKMTWVLCIFTVVILCFATTMLFIGMTIILFSQSIAMLLVGVVIFGFGFQCYNGHIMQLIPMTTVATGATFGISMFFIFTNIGSFLASVVTPAIAHSIMGDALRGDWYVAAVGLLICAIVEFFFCKKVKANVEAGVLK